MSERTDEQSAMAANDGSAGDGLAGTGRLAAQLRFLLEADRLKQVLRQSAITGGSRRENSAEHSWHLALFAMVLAEHASEPVDVARVLRMVLLHDLVEIDAGDTYLYDTVGREAKCEHEQAAAERLFALLPADQAEEWHALRDEFEGRRTVEARFAAALDRLEPLLLNHANGGDVWRRFGITEAQVRDGNAHVGAGSPALWAVAQQVIDDAVEHGWLPPADERAQRANQ